MVECGNYEPIPKTRSCVVAYCGGIRRFARRVAASHCQSAFFSSGAIGYGHAHAQTHSYPDAAANRNGYATTATDGDNRGARCGYASRANAYA
jgi:hypothetical protein